MTSKLTLGKLTLGFLFASFYMACDESTTENITQVNQVGMDVVSAEKDLPECTSENEGAQAFVKGEYSARVCVDEDWVPMTSSVKDTVVLSGDTVYLAGGKDTVYVKDSDLSCKTELLADSSGLKIICNGDSIGVVLNGAKGEKGDTGEPGGEGEPGAAGVGCSIAGQTDSTMTVACGTDTTTIQLNYSKTEDEQESSVDFYQKGFFLRGTDVYLQELEDSRALTQSGNSAVKEVTNDDGFCKIEGRDLLSQYVMAVFDGFYRNVVIGKVSNAPISLKVLTDVTTRNHLNTNPLTHMEFNRIVYLATKQKMTVTAAKRQAKNEVLDLFSMDTTEADYSEDVSMFGTTEASAELLALTILLQGDRSEAEFKELLTEIADDIAEDGEWNNLEKKKEVATWARDADESGRLNEIRERIVKGTDVELPDFIKYIRNFWQKELSN